MATSKNSDNELDNIFNTVFEGEKQKEQSPIPHAPPAETQQAALQSQTAPATQNGAVILCSTCGATNNISNKFCGKCGAFLESVPSSQPSTIACGKCGAKNDNAQRFCNACGAALHNQENIPASQPAKLPNNEALASHIWSRASTGYRVSSPGAVFAILCFFLPWLFVSCGGSTGYSFTGMELAFGKQIEQFAGAGQHTDASPLLILALLTAFAVIGLAVMAIQRGKLVKFDGIGLIGLGAIALLLIGVQGLIYSNDLQSQGMAQAVQLTLQIGFIGVVIGYLAVIVGGVLNALRKS